MAESKKHSKRRDEDQKELNELTLNSLEEANRVQSDLENVSKHMSEKILAVVEEFGTLKKPLYAKRHNALKSVPHFWAISFMNHPKLKLLVDSSVEDCFNYLQSIQVVDNDVLKTGYKVLFGFDVNPYFFNTELIKECSYDHNALSTAKTSIDWKENMNLSSDRRKRGRKRGPPVENFFDWLQRINNGSDVTCEIIKDDLWLDPLKYFFLPDENAEDNSESDSENDDYADDILDSKDEESAAEEESSNQETKAHN